ncbi:MAG: hypothetical protein MUQ10_03505 [Anaerolineae bacterium]|nr:hypothetical protein [Anaerolineae bacterium]
MNSRFKMHVHDQLLTFAKEISDIIVALDQSAITQEEASQRKTHLISVYAEEISAQFNPALDEVPEALALLWDLGVETLTAQHLATRCSLDEVRGWVMYAQCSIGLRNPAGLVVSRLRKQVPAPKLPEAADGASRYLSGEYAAFIQH